jgi:hypothetical protein
MDSTLIDITQEEIDLIIELIPDDEDRLQELKLYLKCIND